jgi:MoxR-like ATPase
MALDPEAAGEVATFVTRGALTMVSEAARGALAGRMTGTFVTEEVPKYGPLPPLTESLHLGDTIGSQVIAEQEAADLEGQRLTLPAGVFDTVVGLDYERGIVRMCVEGEAPQSVLLVGDPGTGKSILMQATREALPEEGRYVDGKQMTPAALAHVVADPRVRVLFIDEIEKADRDAQEALLELMLGRVSTAKMGNIQEITKDLRVIAAANDPGRMSAALRDRFIEIELPHYTQDQRREVMSKVLQTRHGTSALDAERIAREVAPHSTSIRDAEQVAWAEREDPALAREMTERIRKRAAVQPAATAPRTAAPSAKPPKPRRRRAAAPAS